MTLSIHPSTPEPPGQCDDCGSEELVTRYTIKTSGGEIITEGLRCRECHITVGLAAFGLGPDD